MDKGGLLSNDMKVACEIYRHNEDKKEPIWFAKLSEILENEMLRSAVSRSLDKLSDWGIVKREHGETEGGRAGRLLYIANEPKDTIKSVYEEFWKRRDPNDES
ncbi:hypothetical protein AKJ63_01375 [candidate division MSBL1 archaeon SCGC-AAA259D18]|uniref:MarR family transcriptional regulator n=1 Tax=candidate division MSBL1 archaeon SCGC-AAA259D18 TaxID=1698262 RepID=A0A133UBI0_9EURY|nr:hypothetical protein AKJ63_01375 [candidate division MSBL1 archaeon SCGC-AAA259D18]